MPRHSRPQGMDLSPVLSSSVSWSFRDESTNMSLEPKPLLSAYASIIDDDPTPIMTSRTALDADSEVGSWTSLRCFQCWTTSATQSVTAKGTCTHARMTITKKRVSYS
jgi:hypothetical protein